MALYEDWVLPRLLDFAMRNHVLDSYRRGAIESAHGLVLEIGVGSGLNLSLYGPQWIAFSVSIPRPNCCVSPASERRKRWFPSRW